MTRIFTSAIKKALKTTKRRKLKRDTFLTVLQWLGASFFSRRNNGQGISPDSITVRGLTVRSYLPPCVWLTSSILSNFPDETDSARRMSQLLAKANVPSLFVTSFPFTSVNT